MRLLKRLVSVFSIPLLGNGCVHLERPSRLAIFPSLLAVIGLVALVNTSQVQTGVTITIDFDEPEYLNGDSISSIGDITFIPAAKVFKPTRVATFSGDQALKVSDVCTSPDCPNGAYSMVINFGQRLPAPSSGWLYRRADSVSMRIGADSINSACIPEWSTCSIYARLVGFDEHGNFVADSQDVFLLDPFSSTIGFSTPITREIRVNDPSARIVGVMLVYGKDTFSHDSTPIFPGEPQIDHLVVSFPETHPPTLEPPAAPSVQISEPANASQRPYPFETRLRGSVSVPGGIAAFCYRLNGSAGSVSAADCHNNRDLKPDFTFDIPILDAALQAGTNTLSVTVHDLWGRTASSSVNFIALAPPPPRITIWSPTDFQWLDASQSSYLSGSVYTVGRLKGFCIVVDENSPPAPNDCTRDIATVQQGNPPLQPFTFATFLSPQRFAPGAHKISVFAVDRWNGVGRADVNVSLPTDFRIVGMEISQAIQTTAIPLNINGVAAYSGVKLRQRVPTVVRVYANTPYAGNYCCASMFLEGFVPDPGRGEKLLGTLLPDSTPRALTTGAIDVPLAMRADPNGGFVFTLPRDWTAQNGLRLTATLQLPFSLRECAICGGNNVFSVTGINFETPSSIIISPVALVWTNRAGVTVAPPAPAVVFGPMVNISPLPSSNVTVLPYVGTIDITDLVNPATGACRSFTSTCQDAVFERVRLFEIFDHPGFTIGVGVTDVGLERPSAISRFGYIALEPIAVAGTGRPLTSIAHEFYHEMAYYHAGPDCPSVDLYNLWPPDQKGLIQGVGLDRRKLRDMSGYWNGQYRILMPGTQSMPGGQAEYYDLMSYCASTNDVDTWISVKNWNSFGGPFPNGLAPDSVFLGSSTATVSTGAGNRREDAVEVEGGTLLVSAVVDESGGVGTFRAVSSGNLLLAHPPKSNYLFVVRDERQRVVASVPALVSGPPEGPSTGTYLNAIVPARGAASIEIEHEGNTIGALERSATAPEITLNSPQAGASLSRDESLQVAWDAIDVDSVELEIRIEYSAGADKPFRPIFVGPNRGTWQVPGSQLEAAIEGRLRVVVSDGFNESAVVIEPITVQAVPPHIEILAPEAQTNFPHTTPILLQAVAFGNDRNPLLDDQLEWSLDGRFIGNGMEIEVRDLALGRHTAKVVARDGDLTVAHEVEFYVYQQTTAIVSQAPTVAALWPWLLLILLALIVLAWLIIRRARGRAT